MDKDLANYQFSEAGTKIYEFIWKKYCDWYLEISKGQNKNPAVLLYVLRTVLKLLHPFIPFVTEKLWELLGEKKLLISENWPAYDKNLIFAEEAKTVDIIYQVISEIRKVRAESKVEPGKKIHAIIYGGKFTNDIKSKQEALMRLCRLEKLEISKKGPNIQNAKSIVVKNIEIYLPLKDMVDPKKENSRIEFEIGNLEKFIKNMQNTLNNPKFLEKAPKELIERNKERIKSETVRLEKLKSLRVEG